MTAFDYAVTDWEIREDIPSAHQRFWSRLAKPGSWWTGEERIAIAAESRAALTCELCKTRKQALSPYASSVSDTAPQTHTRDTNYSAALPEAAVDAVHRIITDQSRITRRFVEENASNTKDGLSKGAYVELVGLVVATFSIDEFHRALGLPIEALPEAQPGEITRYKPQHLSDDIGFVPTIPLDGAVGPEADLWPTGRTANVARALTLVPDALRDWQSLGAAQYLSFPQMADMGQQEGRALNRMQIETIAGRVSAINECFY